MSIMEIIGIFILGAIWVVLAVVDVMVVMPLAFNNPTWYNVAFTIILTSGLMIVLAIVNQPSTGFGDPYLHETYHEC